MSLPTSRDTLKQFCLRQLGAPNIPIAVTDDQLNDCIDLALALYTDYHYDGTQVYYYKYQLQQQDITNQYLTLPSNIIGAVELFPMTGSLSTNNLFSVQYQFMANDILTLFHSTTSIIPYYMAFSHLSQIEEWLVGQRPFSYNRKTNLFYIYTDWTTLTPGQYIMIKCYQVLDPNQVPKIYADRALIKLATAYIKRTWGNTTKLLKNVRLPGGVILDGQAIYDEAVKEVFDLEREFQETWSLPVTDFIA